MDIAASAPAMRLETFIIGPSSQWASAPDFNPKIPGGALPPERGVPDNRRMNSFPVTA
jgi:hypothetical protein